MFQGFTPKRKIAMRAGETEKAISVDPNRIKDIVHQNTSKLCHRGNLE